MNDGYNEDGTPKFKVHVDDPRKDAREERIEAEKKKRRWLLGRMYQNAVEMVKRMAGKK